jgi:hypothetical protein
MREQGLIRRKEDLINRVTMVHQQIRAVSSPRDNISVGRRNNQSKAINSFGHNMEYWQRCQQNDKLPSGFPCTEKCRQEQEGAIKIAL